MGIYSNKFLTRSEIIKIYLLSRLCLFTSKDCNIYTIKYINDTKVSIRSYSSLDNLSNNYIYYSYRFFNDVPVMTPNKFYINFIGINNKKLNIFLPLNIKKGDIIAIFRNTNYITSGHILMA